MLIASPVPIFVRHARSLATLAKELDKAWKMVDGAQEKDKRARETIQRLKEEMKKLSQLVDQVRPWPSVAKSCYVPLIFAAARPFRYSSGGIVCSLLS